jgi:hypothetical protein
LNNLPARLPVEWLIDTGADISGVNGTVGGTFATTGVKGATANPLWGAVGFTVVKGIQVELDVVDTSLKVQTVATKAPTRYTAVRNQARGINVVGMNHLAELKATVEWNPDNQSGDLVV